MLKGEAKKKYQREYMKKQRSNIEPTGAEGLTSYPDILDKLTDKVWRAKMEKICLSFRTSHHPDYINDVWLGDFNMSQVCELLECTA